MTENNHFLLALEALNELAPEIKAAKATRKPSLPSLMDVLTELPLLPRDALFLGMADDGLPILLDMLDTVPGPLLVITDEGNGKTGFLRHAAIAVNKLHSKEDVQFGVITPNPEEWKDIQGVENCSGIFPVYHRNAKEYIFSLGEWAHTNRSRESRVLFIDDFHRMLEMDADVKDSLRWLLLRGPARHVWPIVTLKSSEVERVRPWLDFFRTRILGPIKDKSIADSIAEVSTTSLESLIPGVQYAMRDGMDWLKFWIPGIDH
jgi:hypothetical protein